MAFWYSVRLSRRNVSVRPGFGWSADAASSEDSTESDRVVSGFVRPLLFRPAASDGCGAFERPAPRVSGWRVTSCERTLSRSVLPSSRRGRGSPRNTDSPWRSLADHPGKRAGGLRLGFERSAGHQQSRNPGENPNHVATHICGQSTDRGSVFNAEKRYPSRGVGTTRKGRQQKRPLTDSAQLCRIEARLWQPLDR